MNAKKPSGGRTPAKRFPFDVSYNFSLRPRTYWPELPSEQTLLASIEGTERRDIARRALAGEELPRRGDEELYREAMEFVLQDKLENDERERWGAIHPALMGGEYLPARENDEAEIVRIELASTTADVIQVRAQPTRAGIHYRAVDEYWDQGSRYTITPAMSKQPLTLGELVELIDTAQQGDKAHIDPDRNEIGLVDGIREAAYQEGSEAEDLVGFIKVSSIFYPQLGSYYEDRARHWYETILLERLDDEIEESASLPTIVRAISPTRYSPQTLLFPSRGRQPAQGDRVVNRLAVERWMRYVAGLDRFTLVRGNRNQPEIRATWREGNAKRTVELDNSAGSLIPLARRNREGEKLLARDLDSPKLELPKRVELALAMRKTRKAEELLAELAETRPLDAAEFLAVLGRTDAAKPLFHEAADDDPFAVGWTLLKAGLTDEAEKVFRTIDDDAEAIRGLAAAAHQRGDNATALELLDSITPSTDDYDDLLLPVLGSQRLARGRTVGPFPRQRRKLGRRDTMTSPIARAQRTPRECLSPVGSVSLTTRRRSRSLNNFGQPCVDNHGDDRSENLSAGSSALGRPRGRFTPDQESRPN